MNKMLLKQSRRRRSTPKVNYEEESILFKPQTGKAPKNRNFKVSKIGEHLYSFSNKKTKPVVEPNTVSLSNEYSDVILRRLKAKRYKELFNALGPQNGRLSKETIKDRQLSEPVHSVMKPFLEEIEEPLSFKEFSEIMEVYTKLLSPLERSTLVSTSKRKFTPQPLPFKPQVNASQAPRVSISLYERGIVKKNEVQYNLEKERIMQAANELESCTFKPQISHSKIIYS